MSYRSAVLIALFIALTAATAHAQHGRPRVPVTDPESPGPNPWVARLIEAINIGTGVEAWQQKEAMRMRIEIDFDPPSVEAENEEGGEVVGGDASDRAGEPAMPICGLITYDLRGRIMRFDVDDGPTFLVSRKEIAMWLRDGEAALLEREDISDDELNMARALFHLVAMPLWINDKEGFFTPGGLRQLGDERLYASAYIIRDTERTQEDVEDSDGERPGVSGGPRQYPDDWYVFFSRTREPHRIDAAAYLVHDRSRPLTEFPMPRLVFFDEFEEVEGVAISRAWRIHNFSRAQGLGERIGSAKVTAVEFVVRDDELFELPARATRLR